MTRVSLFTTSIRDKNCFSRDTLLMCGIKCSIGYFLIGIKRVTKNKTIMLLLVAFSFLERLSPLHVVVAPFEIASIY